MEIVGMSLLTNLVANMKLVYIKHDNTILECFRLEIGKTYEILISYNEIVNSSNIFYFQVQNEEESMFYNKECFITLEQYRENKINKILNE